MSQVKHFAAYNQETNRNTAGRQRDRRSSRTLHEIYLPAFEAAVEQAKAALGDVLVLDDQRQLRLPEPVPAQPTTLKQEWDFPGFVTSDYGALHSTTGGALDGTDQEQPFDTYFGTAARDRRAERNGPAAVLNTMVQRILTEMFRFNLFDNPPTGTPPTTVTTPAHQAVGTDVADTGRDAAEERGAARCRCRQTTRVTWR